MQEFDSVSVSSFEAGTLSAKLTERSAEGWEVVTILSAGSDVVAFLKRSTAAAADISEIVSDPAPVTEQIPATADAEATTASDWGSSSETSPSASEPAGWGSAPEPTPAASESSWGGDSTTADTASSDSWGTSPAPEPASSDWGSGTSTPAAADSGWGTTSSADDGWGTTGTGTPAAATPAAGPSQGAAPAVPPGWFTDPSNRYELRYWDGSAWTEHVARGGQQFTDPPVA